MILTILAQEQPEHGGAGLSPTDVTNDANLKAAAWSLVIVVVLFAILGKFAWGPIVKGLQAREDRINESLKRAEELERATRELAETNRRAMEKAQQEAQQVVADARVAAQKAAGDVMAKAHVEIEASKERFQREMRLEGEKIRADIRKDAVDLTLLATAKMLGRTLSGADHARLADEALRDAESVARN